MMDIGFVIDGINSDAEAGRGWWVCEWAKDPASNAILSHPEHMELLHPIARNAVEHYREELS